MIYLSKGGCRCRFGPYVDPPLATSNPSLGPICYPQLISCQTTKCARIHLLCSNPHPTGMQVTNSLVRNTPIITGWVRGCFEQLLVIIGQHIILSYTDQIQTWNRLLVGKEKTWKCSTRAEKTKQNKTKQNKNKQTKKKKFFFECEIEWRKNC